MASNTQCQRVIKTLLHAAQSSNSSPVIVRELVLQNASAGNISCLETIGASDALEEYKRRLGKGTMDRIMNYDESSADYNRIQHANTVVIPGLVQQLKRNRTWTTWWEMVTTWNLAL
jgi:hypothetical protein